jgi:hypothetical protein
MTRLAAEPFRERMTVGDLRDAKTVRRKP